MHICQLESGQRLNGFLYGDIQTVVNNWLLYEGHSIGIGDTIADPGTYQDIVNTIQASKVEVGEEGLYFFSHNEPGLSRLKH